MEERELAEGVEQQQYFEAAPAPSPEDDKGTRDMGPLYPFLISGGTNTERYYFMHINDTTEYKFNIRPKYFADESNYTEAFLKRIEEILNANTDSKIFCVFDWDTVFCNETNQKKHQTFEDNLKREIDEETVVLCPSMPSIEYWFLLHFENYTDLIKSCGTKLQKLLSPHMLPYFLGTNKKLLNLLKDKKYVESPDWVIELCNDGKLELAIERAENNINAAVVADELKNQSYSYVYKAFKER